MTAAQTFLGKSTTSSKTAEKSQAVVDMIDLVVPAEEEAAAGAAAPGLRGRAQAALRVQTAWRRRLGRAVAAAAARSNLRTVNQRYPTDSWSAYVAAPYAGPDCETTHLAYFENPSSRRNWTTVLAASPAFADAFGKQPRFALNLGI